MERRGIQLRESKGGRGRPEPQLRRAGDRTPLGRVIGRIEYCWGTGAYAQAAELLEEDFLAAWYGFSPDRLAEIVATLAREGEVKSPLLLVANTAFSPGGVAGLLTGDGIPGSDDDDASRESLIGPTAIVLVTQMFALRVQGRAREAMEVSAELERRFGGIRPIFDSLRGWGLFSSVQHGITAMLAGDFGVAIESFTQARMHPLYPPLAFLARDACVKAAILEALYGSVEQARHLLDRAGELPRTESWAEEVIDAGQTIAAALVRADGPAEALRMLDGVSLGEIGEIWPFYVVALQRICLLADGLGEARRRVEVIERLPLPYVEGQGFSGSALPLAGARRATMSGDLAEARGRLERADGSIAVARMLLAELELGAGRPREALTHAAELHGETQHLRALETRRLAVISGSQLALGSPDECREVLQFALLRPGGLRPDEVLLFPAEVRRFAEERLEEWPRTEPDSTVHSGAFLDSGAALTERELEVLRELAAGLSREQIAKAQYISINTLKAHLRSVYRKLGVNSRAGAVLEAERRGLI